MKNIDRVILVTLCVVLGLLVYRQNKIDNYQDAAMEEFFSNTFQTLEDIEYDMSRLINEQQDSTINRRVLYYNGK